MGGWVVLQAFNTKREGVVINLKASVMCIKPSGLQVLLQMFILKLSVWQKESFLLFEKGWMETGDCVSFAVFIAFLKS